MKPLATKAEVFASVLGHSQILRRYGVSRLGVFGSFQRGEVNDHARVVKSLFW